MKKNMVLLFVLFYISITIISCKKAIAPTVPAEPNQQQTVEAMATAIGRINATSTQAAIFTQTAAAALWSPTRTPTATPTNTQQYTDPNALQTAQALATFIGAINATSTQAAVFTQTAVSALWSATSTKTATPTSTATLTSTATATATPTAYAVEAERVVLQLDGHDISAAGVAVNSNTGYMYMFGGSSVMVFDAGLNYVTTWYNYDPSYAQTAAIAVDSDTGNVFVSVFEAVNRISLDGLSIDGSYYSSSDSPGLAIDSSHGFMFTTGANKIYRYGYSSSTFLNWGTAGSGNGCFSNPKAVAVDGNTGRVYVADTGNNRVQVFSESGEYISKWGSYGSAGGYFDNPYAIVADSRTGRVYVADSSCRIQVFNGDGTYITQWDAWAGSYSDGISGLAINSNTGGIYVIDSGYSVIQIYKVYN
jgi:DNA-binding beta-propeller fold protein YncE